MPPYVIRQGDYLLKLAHQLGFDPDTVWNDPSNSDLRALRPDPNILFPGDLLQIPSSASQPPPPTSLAPGSTNAFVSTPPTIAVSAKFVGADGTPCASQAYSIVELPQLTGLATDANGVVTFQASVTLETATIVFSDTGVSCALAVGGMDPIETLSGIFKRLQNLGFIGANFVFDPSNLDLLRNGLSTLQAAQGGAAPASSPASAPPPSSASGPASSTASAEVPPAVAAGPALDTPGPSASDAPPSAPASAPTSSPPASGPSSSPPASGPSSSPPASTPPTSAPASTPPPSDPPASSPDSSPVSSAPASIPVPVDDAGLSDDGTLSDEMKALLLQAHGY